MGESLICFYRSRVKKEWKLAFVAAFVSCLLIHIYKFANTLPNHDSFYNVYFDQNMTVSGRWFLTFACGISSYFDLPWINGLLCAVYLGVTAAIVTELFDLKNPVVIVLSATILTATPSTTETLFVEFTADGYLMGLVFSGFAACLSCKGSKWYHFVLSGAFVCLSCAIYQAYVSFAAVLCICYLVQKLLDCEISVSGAWKWIGKHVLIYGAALAAYYGIWKLILFATGQTATDYQGISEVGRIGISTLISGAAKSIKNVLLFFLEWNVLEHPITLYAALNIVFILAFGMVIVTASIKSGTYRNLPRLLMIIFCLAASVPVISIWNFLSESMQYRPMMLHSICVFYIFALILFDRWVGAKVSTLFGLFMAVIVFNFAIMANISYFYLDKCYEKSYYMGSQMMERIEETLESEEVEYIAFVGSRADKVAITPGEPGDQIHILSSLLESDLLYDNVHAHLYLQGMYGLRLPRVTAEQLEAMEADPNVQSMGIWPAENSVDVIDGVLVIKLADSATMEIG